MKKIVIYQKGNRTYFKQYGKFICFWIRQFIYWSDENIDDIIDKHIASMQKSEPDLIIEDMRAKITVTSGTVAGDILILANKHARDSN